MVGTKLFQNFTFQKIEIAFDLRPRKKQKDKLHLHLFHLFMFSMRIVIRYTKCIFHFTFNTFDMEFLLRE